MKSRFQQVVIGGIIWIATVSNVGAITLGTLTITPASTIPEVIKRNGTALAFDTTQRFCNIKSSSSTTMTVQVKSVTSNYGNGAYHWLRFGSGTAIKSGGSATYNVSTTDTGLFPCISTSTSSYSAASSVATNDYSAVYRVAITQGSTTKFFDLLCGGKCDTSSTSVSFTVDGAERVPEVVSKNTSGAIVIAPPQQVATIRPPKGHTMKATITLSTVNPAQPKVANFLCIGVKKQSATDYTRLYKSTVSSKYLLSTTITGITETDPLEIATQFSKVDLSTGTYSDGTGTVITKLPDTLGVPSSGAFDFSSVYRISIAASDA